MALRGDTRLAGARIVAASQSPYTKYPTSSALQLLVETTADLLHSYGILPSEVDGLGVSSFQLAPDNAVTVAEHLGIEVSWACQGIHGGAAGIVTVMQAAEAITAGRAEIVVCAAADAFDVNSHMSMLDSFNTGMRDYLAPYGFGGTNGLFALVETKHRSLYGTTREQLGKLAVTQRKHAQLNPNALLRDDMTLEQYLTARPIAEPLGLFDCVMPCAGADVVVLMSTAQANTRGLPGITVLSAEQRHNAFPQDILCLTSGAAQFADELFGHARIQPHDLDFVQLYDDYPIMELIQLEDLGFAKKGGGGQFIDDTDFSLGGNLPLNTGGGQLSCGQAGASGGMIGVYEACAQLLGQADARQLAHAQLGLVSGFGMVGYGRGLSSAALILERSL